MKNCGVSIHNIGKLISTQIFCSIFYPITHYLLKQQLLINRVLITNSGDVIFQGDPFNSNIHNSAIYFHHEHHFHYENAFMQLWFETTQIFGFSYPNHSLVINGGYIIGGIRPVLQYLDLFFSFFNSSYLNNENEFVDQSLLNCLIYNGYLDKAHITYYISNELTRACSIGYDVNYPENFFSEFPFARISPNSTSMCTFTHQYDRHDGYLDTVFKSCPQNEFIVPDFLRYPAPSVEE